MEYREPQDENNLFFTCSLIEYIARSTHNKKVDVLNQLGMATVRKIYEISDVLHCENIEQVIYSYVTEYKIANGNYDYKTTCIYKIPDPFEIGRVYQRLILDVARAKNEDRIDVLFAVFSSWIIEVIDNFNSDMYYSSPDYIYACYMEGEILEG